MEGIELVSALALLLGADLGCARKRLLERSLEFWLAGDLATDVADQAAEPRPQQAQLPTMALELFGMGIASCHHHRLPGNAQIGLPQPHTVRAGQPVEPPDRRMDQLGIGREGNGLGLHGGVHRHPLEIARAQRAGLVRHPQALGQQELQLVAEPLAPMAEVASLMRELVLEKLKAGEVLEIRIIDPALADVLIGQAVDVLEQQQSDDETAFDPRPTLLAVERRDLAIDPTPVDLAAELHQLVLHIDDLIQPGPKQIAFPSRLRLLWSHRSPPLRHRITTADS